MLDQTKPIVSILKHIWMDKQAQDLDQKKVTQISLWVILKPSQHQEPIKWRIKWELQIILMKRKMEHHHHRKKKIKAWTSWEQTDQFWTTTLRYPQTTCFQWKNSTRNNLKDFNTKIIPEVQVLHLMLINNGTVRI